ncbi:cyclic nucleotide-binding domain-containing protein [Emticicia agri]|nr:cyclic nucleotide-binding domain-containing protein [Emticicia agri]
MVESKSMSGVAQTEERPKESRLLILFFLHNFFISIGTVLVYVSANLILLEHHPEVSLPVAYIASTFAMMGVGKIYEYYEHHLVLKKLSVRVLLAVLVLSIIIGTILFFNHSTIVAIGIMVGFRVIYLLVNLEFWGVSALVFDVRQSKRLFSVIGSGDVPAKAIGAILAALIHSTSVLAILVLVAFVTFLLAFFTQKRTFELTEIPSHHQNKIRRPTESKMVETLFGGSRLVFEMCIGLVAIAASATWVEYNFFVNVKYKFHSQHDVIQFVGYLLAITYAISTIVKLLFSSKVIDKFGLKNALLLLPIGTLLMSVLLVGMSSYQHDDSSLLFDFSAAYLCFEVLRRTAFDPVFLVMFQPLSTQQRLKGHTLAKGFYEPLGMGIAGILLLIAYFVHSSEIWIAFAFTVLLSLLALFFLNKAYKRYIIELKNALSKRFLKSNELVVQGDALGIILKNLTSDKPEEVISAIDWIVKFEPKVIQHQVELLLKNKSDKVRLHILTVIRNMHLHLDAEFLRIFNENETDPLARRISAEIACASASSPEQRSHYLNAKNIYTVEGAIIACWKLQRTEAKAKLDALCASTEPSHIYVALEIIAFLHLKEYETFVRICLEKETGEIKEKAIEVAGSVDSPVLIKSLVQLLEDRLWGKKAINSLIKSGGRGFEEVEALSKGGDTGLLQKVVLFSEKYQSLASERLLIRLAQNESLHVRQMALKVLSRRTNAEDYEAMFEKLLQEELAHAYQVLHGFITLKDTLLQYELGQSSNRIFYLLMLLYDKDMVQDAMMGVEHSSKEKRANALEILDNIIPRDIYKCLHAMLDETEVDKKIAVFDAYFNKGIKTKPIVQYVLEKGNLAFGDWTIVMALRQWEFKANKNQLFEKYIGSQKKLLNEATKEIILNNPDLTEKYKDILAMQHGHDENEISELERVIVLKNTQLFSETPENVLTSIVPIMNEVTYHEGQEIFQKGAIGNCMYVIYSGEIGIVDHDVVFATFGKGDIFGELALLDSEPRSATALVKSDALLFRIDQDDFYDLMEERDELLRSVLRILCQRIRAQNDKLRRLSVQ